MKSKFGQCPECQGEPDRILNHFQELVCLCDDCKTYWQVAPILAQRWKREIPANWEQNGNTLADYRRVEPINYPQVENMQTWQTPGRYRP